MTRVVVAHDQAVVRAGFAAILNAAPGVEVVGAASNGRELLHLVATHAPDVAVVDVRMPVLDGIEATARIALEHPATRVLILTTFDLDAYVHDALRAGASGFLLKDVPAERLIEAVRLVAEGSMLLGPHVTRQLIADFAAQPRRADAVARLAELTPREREVVTLIAQGLSNTEIAARLFVSETTVKSHVSVALRKLGCRDRVQIVITAYEGGLVETGVSEPG